MAILVISMLKIPVSGGRFKKDLEYLNTVKAVDNFKKLFIDRHLRGYSVDFRPTFNHFCLRFSQLRPEIARKVSRCYPDISRVKTGVGFCAA